MSARPRPGHTLAVLPRSALAAIGLGLALGLLAGPVPGPVPGPVRAQGDEAPRFEIPLYSPYLVVRAAGAGRPVVRLTGPDGGLKIAVEAGGERPADGRWTVVLRTPAMEPTEVVTVDPGDTVAVEVDGQRASVVVPRLTAAVDTAADVVAGTVPPTLAVFVVAGYDEGLHGPRPAADPVVVTAADGRYRAELGDRIDLAPGTFGYVATADAAQNLFVLAFAPPLLTVSPARFTALVRANADARPEVAVVDALGTEIARSGPPITLAPGFFGVILLRGGRPENGAFQPRPGERVALILDQSVAAEATLPDVTASIDAAARRVGGRAPAGARVVVTARPSEAGGDTVVRTTAGDDGRYAAAFPALAFADDALAFALAWSGGGVAYEVAGRVPFAEIELWGHVLRGFVDGRGELRVVHTPADGRPPSSRVVVPEIDGRFEADVFDRAGQPARFAPGDALTLTPQDGAPLAVTVPRVTARVAAGGRRLEGEAPPGAALAAEVFADEPSYFAPRPVPSPSITLSGAAGPDGGYALTCDRAGCPARYGRLVARTGAVRAVLRWVDQPVSGIGVTLSTAFGWATAGEAVTVAFDDGTVRTAIAQPTQPDRLPLWEIDLRDLYRDGIPLGTRLRLGVGDAATDVTVAPVTWQADVLADRVTGTAPAVHAVIVVAEPADPDRTATATTVVSGLDGRFAADLPGFNLRSGDRLTLYVIRPGDRHVLQYVDPGVAGPEEPPSTATATTTPPATRRPTATATAAAPTPARGEGRTAYLPFARR